MNRSVVSSTCSIFLLFAFPCLISSSRVLFASESCGKKLFNRDSTVRYWLVSDVRCLNGASSVLTAG
jgi:hypothetical protein